MGNRNVIRVRPISFETDWQADMKAAGVKVPKAVPETRYTPVNHDPTPYSIAVDLTAKRVVRRIVGVMPNATYSGKIYSWDEFRALLRRLYVDGGAPEAPAAVRSEFHDMGIGGE